MSSLILPAPLTEPDELSPAQQRQMDADLALLLPDGPHGTNKKTGLPLLTPKARMLGEETPILNPRVQTVKKPVLHWRRFPMGGWVYWQVEARMQRPDQGQDFEIPLGHHIIAPSWGKCVHHLSDGPFPNGFGNPYAVVYIGSGRFGGRLWYIGHDNAEVIPAGWTFHQGRILSRPDHSLNAGWGWTELGWAPGGYPGAFGDGARFHGLFAPLWRWSAT